MTHTPICLDTNYPFDINQLLDINWSLDINESSKQQCLPPSSRRFLCLLLEEWPKSCGTFITLTRVTSHWESQPLCPVKPISPSLIPPSGGFKFGKTKKSIIIKKRIENKITRLSDVYSKLAQCFSQLEKLIVETTMAEENDCRNEELPENEARKQANSVQIRITTLSFLTSQPSKSQICTNHTWEKNCKGKKWAGSSETIFLYDTGEQTAIISSKH